MSERALFINLVGVLADGQRLRRQFAHGMAALMTERYGLSAADWIAAYQAIVADWHSYHDDLNFSGDDGMAHIRESRYRITRALFRCAGVPEPSQPELIALAETLIVRAPASGDALYPAAREWLQDVHRAGWRIAVIAHWPQMQIEAVLRGAGIEAITTALGVDTFGRYEHDLRFFQAALRLLSCPASNCRVMTHNPITAQHAQAAGLNTQILSAAALNQSSHQFVLE